MIEGDGRKDGFGVMKMVLINWEELPENMRCQGVRLYYEVLRRKKNILLLKFIFDRVMAFLLLILLLPVFLLVAAWIRLDSPGEVFFRQERVTRYGRRFRIYKFRTMVKNAESMGSQVTTKQDMRVTNVGRKIRACRLDEIPQLINILKGEMSFVGTRPEVPRYVAHYTDEMLATLLLPAGVTSQASIQYKDEEKLLTESDNADKTYIEKVLPDKMGYNLREIKDFSFVQGIMTMVETVIAVAK